MNNTTPIQDNREVNAAEEISKGLISEFSPDEMREVIKQINNYIEEHYSSIVDNCNSCLDEANTDYRNFMGETTVTLR